MNTREGLPLNEEQIKEWQQAFIDIEESIKFINKQNEKKVKK